MSIDSMNVPQSTVDTATINATDNADVTHSNDSLNNYMPAEKLPLDPKHEADLRSADNLQPDETTSPKLATSSTCQNKSDATSARNSEETCTIIETQTPLSGGGLLTTLSTSQAGVEELLEDSHANSSQFSPPLVTNDSIIHKADVSPQPNLMSKSLHSSSITVVEQPLDNLLVMIKQQREALLEGPQITVYIGKVVVEEISKRAAMAASRGLNKHLTKHPESLEYYFSKDFMSPDAVCHLLKTWIEEISGEFEAWSVPIRPTFEKNVELLRAARLLGMERYTAHILAQFIDYVKTHLPLYKEIAVIEHNATSDKDPLWTNMVNHLCHDRHKGLFPDPEEFEAFLGKHQRLKKAMEAADIFFSSMAQQKWEAKEARRRQQWEHNQAEKRDRLACEKAVAESLKQKMDTKGSGLLTVTAEEAAMLRGR